MITFFIIIQGYLLINLIVRGLYRCNFVGIRNKTILWIAYYVNRNPEQLQMMHSGDWRKLKFQHMWMIPGCRKLLDISLAWHRKQQPVRKQYQKNN